MKDTIMKVLAQTMGIDASTINESRVIRDIEGFDSLRFVMFISELEESYKISIPIDAALEAEIVGDLISKAERK